MRALVVYGTRWGGTVDIAEKIGRVLVEEGYAADVVNCKNKPKNLEKYDLFLIGSGISADKWTKEMMVFLQKNAELLRAKKTALFVSCRMADRESEREKATGMYLEKIAEMYSLKPISLALFGAYMNFDQSHGLLVDLLIKINRKSLRRDGLDTSKIYDTRDWAIIKKWAREVSEIASK